MKKRRKSKSGIPGDRSVSHEGDEDDEALYGGNALNGGEA